MLKSNRFRPSMECMEGRAMMSATPIPGTGGDIWLMQDYTNAASVSGDEGIYVGDQGNAEDGAAGGITKFGSRRLILKGD